MQFERDPAPSAENPLPPPVRLEDGRLTGQQLQRLMRQFRVTIRELAQRTGITQKRIREVRSGGLADRHAIRDWIEAITGSDPGPM